MYGELTAETRDSYYLTYSLYHAKDYDHPLREWFTDWTYHDSDNEGFMIRVDRETLAVAQVETWFHNRFLLYDATGTSRGTEPVHGAIHLEHGSRLVVYSQPQGHGVRAFQVLDEDALAERLDAVTRGHAIAAALAALRADERDAICLVALAGLTHEQAAVALGIPPGTMASRLHRARSRLRPLLSTEDEPANKETS